MGSRARRGHSDSHFLSAFVECYSSFDVRSLLCLIFTALTLASAPFRAEAQGLGSGLAAPRAQPARRAPATTTPDVVLLRDGGMIRGTIVRSVPGRGVVIQTVTGDVERIGWDRIRYSGVASGAPFDSDADDFDDFGADAPRRAAAVAAPRTAPGEVVIEFRSDQSEVFLYRFGGTTHAEASGFGVPNISAHATHHVLTCGAPCTLTLRTGPNRLALGLGESRPLSAGIVNIPTEGTLYGSYVDNGGLRTGGWMLIIFGLVGIAAGGLPAIMDTLLSRGSLLGDNLPFFITGGVVGLVLLLAGIPLAAANNGAVIRFE